MHTNIAMQSQPPTLHFTQDQVPPTPAAADKLYEGNFSSWCNRISTIFMSKGRPSQTYPSILISPTGRKFYFPSKKDDIKTICLWVHPSLLARISMIDITCAGELYAALKNLCKPFRLLDLPGELREKVYLHAVVSDEIQHAFTRTTEPSTHRHAIPALAQASHQLREEVLPIYFSNNTFCFDSEPLVSRPPLNNASATANANTVQASSDSTRSAQDVAHLWVENALHCSPATCLRKVEIHLPCRKERRQFPAIVHAPPFVIQWNLAAIGLVPNNGPRYAKIHLKLRFDPTVGLQIELPKNMTAESKELVEERVVAIEEERKTKGWKGQAILRATAMLCKLSREDDLWLKAEER